MNKIYKVIYCKATQTWVAVSEITKSHGKGGVVGSRHRVENIISFAGNIKALTLAVLMGLGFSQQAVAGEVCYLVPGAAQGTSTGALSLACGSGATTGAAINSTAIGQNAQVLDNKKLEGNGTAVGTNAISGPQSVAVGSEAQTSYVNKQGITKPVGKAVAIGYQAKGLKPGATAVGAGAESSDRGVAIGSNAHSGAFTHDPVTGTYTFDRANKKVTQTTAIGDLALASGDQATALGANAMATGNSSISIGGDDLDRVASKEGTVLPGWGVAVADVTAAEALNNTDVAKKYKDLTGDILVHYENTKGNPASGTYPAHGEDHNGADGTPDRYQSTKSGEGAVAVGVSSTAGDLATSFGTRANADGVASIAIGVGSHATMDNAVAIGAGSKTDVVGTKRTGTTIDGFTYKWAGGINIKEGDVVSIGSSVNGATGKSYERQLKNVAAGEVSEKSTDAINGSQLYSITDALQKADRTYFHTNDGTNAGIGNAITNNGQSTDSAGATGKNATAAGIKAQAAGASSTAVGYSSQAKGASDIAIGNGAKTIGDKTDSSIAIGRNAEAQKARSTAIGYNAKADGDTAIAIGALSGANADGSVALGRNAKTSLAQGVALGTDALADTDKGQVGVDPLGVASKKQDSTWKANLAAVSIGDGTKNLTRQITDVAAGTQDTDAVNVAQLKAVATTGFNIAADNSSGNESDTANKADHVNLGETVTYTSTDSNIKTTVDANKIDFGLSNVVTIGKTKPVKIDGDKGEITGLTNTDAIDLATTPTGGKAATQEQVFNTITKNPLTFAGDSGTEFTRKLGEKTNVKGGSTGTLTDGNIGVVADGTDTLTIKLAETIDLGTNGSVKMGDTTINNDGMTIVDGPSVTKTGIDAGNKKITNVADGDISSSSKDAVNGSQIHNIATKNAKDVFGGNAKVNADGSTSFTDVGGTGEDTIHDAIKSINTAATTANKGFTIAGNSDKAGTTDKTIKPTDTFTVVGDATNTDFKKSDAGKNIYTQVSDNKITVALAKDIEVDSVKAGDTTINNDGMTITGGPSVTKTGIDAGSKKITGVTAGGITASSKDAVNGSQIHNIATKNAKDVFGGNAKVNADGSTSFTDVGGTGEDTIHDAIKSINTTANAGFTVKGAAATTASDDKIKPNDTFNIVGADANTDFTKSDAGKNIYTVVDADNTVRIGLAKDIEVDSVKATKSISVGAPNAQQVVIDGENRAISGLKGTLKTNSVTEGSSQVDIDTSKAATVGDVLNAGWNLQEDGTAKDFVKAYDTVNFVKGSGTTVSITNSGKTTNEIKVNINTDKTTIDVGSDGKVTAVTGDITTKDDGTVAAGDKPDALTTASDVADAINSAYHNVAGTNSEVQATGTDASAKISAGDTVTVEAGKNLVLDADENGKLTLSTATEVAFEKVTGTTVVIGDSTGDSTTLTSTADGLSVGGDKITNVAVGDISADSTDAVNGSQLFNQVAASKEEVKSDDKSVTVTTTQNDVGANVFDLSVNTDGTTITKDPTTGAVKAVTSDITSGDDGSVTATTPTSLATAGDVAEAINNSGFTVGNANTDALVTESTGSTVINPGDSLTIEAGKNLSSSFDAETGELKISTADDVNFNSVESDTVVIGDSTGDSTILTSTADGLSVGGDKITNIAAGTADTDAVNVSQLNDVADDVANNTTNISNNTTNITNNAADIATNTTNITNNAADIATNISNITTNAADIAENADNIALGLNFAADSGDTVNRQLGDTVDITGDGNITTVTTDTGVEVQLASDLTADSLKAGNTVVNTDGMTISGDDAGSTVSLGKTGLNNGGNTITNVAPGVNGTDAVNVDQLNAMGNRLSTRINEVEDEANAGTASALAAANLPQPHDPGASMVSAGLGYYEGEGAFAVGVSTISDNGRWILKGSATVNTESNVGVGAGIGYQW